MKKIVLIALIVLFGSAACKKYTAAPVPNTEPIIYPDTSAKVMFINASPNSVPVDFLVNAVRIYQTNLAYPSTTPYIKFKPDSTLFKANVTGTTVEIISTKKFLSKKKAYSFYLVDNISNKAHLFLEDDLETPTTGKTKVRFIHLSPDSPAFDIATTGGIVFVSNKAFKSATGFLNLNSGDYNFELRLAGTSTVQYALPKMTLEEGKLYTLFIKGYANGTNLQSFGTQLINNN
jgi:Domain of unknown function (DUF4397)